MEWVIRVAAEGCFALVLAGRCNPSLRTIRRAEASRIGLYNIVLNLPSSLRIFEHLTLSTLFPYIYYVLAYSRRMDVPLQYSFRAESACLQCCDTFSIRSHPLVCQHCEPACAPRYKNVTNNEHFAFRVPPDLTRCAVC